MPPKYCILNHAFATIFKNGAYPFLRSNKTCDILEYYHYPFYYYSYRSTFFEIYYSSRQNGNNEGGCKNDLGQAIVMVGVEKLSEAQAHVVVCGAKC